MPPAQTSFYIAVVLHQPTPLCFYIAGYSMCLLVRVTQPARFSLAVKAGGVCVNPLRTVLLVTTLTQLASDCQATSLLPLRSLPAGTTMRLSGSALPYCFNLESTLHDTVVDVNSYSVLAVNRRSCSGSRNRYRGLSCRAF